jgi:hypothetical protein
MSRREWCLGALGAALLPALRLEAAPVGQPLREGSLKYSDVRLSSKVPVRGWRISLDTTATKSGGQRDPKYNISYPFAVRVSTLEDMQSSDFAPVPRFRIWYLKREDEPFARLIGSIMARLYWLGVDYLGVPASEKAFTTLWLAREGMPGGEESDENIWLFAIDTPRAPAEWLRELAHEYGHATLPTLGPFAKPERWANGYLGERLYLKWLLHDNAQTDIWSEPIDAAGYMANQVKPLRDRFLNGGPEAPEAQKIDAEGMDYLIGQILALEAAHGPAFMRETISRIGSPGVKGLPVVYAAAARALPGGLPLDPSVYIPNSAQGVEAGEGGAVRFLRAGYRFYLPTGTWAVQAEGTVPAETRVSFDGKLLARSKSQPAAGASWDTGEATSDSGWRVLEVVAPAGQKVELRRLTLVNASGASR